MYVFKNLTLINKYISPLVSHRNDFVLYYLKLRSLVSEILCNMLSDNFFWDTLYSKSSKTLPIPTGLPRPSKFPWLLPDSPGPSWTLLKPQGPYKTL